MSKAFVYGRALAGTIPTGEEFERLEDFFGVTRTGEDGSIHGVIGDRDMVELLRVLYENTVRMAMAADLMTACGCGFKEVRERALLMV